MFKISYTLQMLGSSLCFQLTFIVEELSKEGEGVDFNGVRAYVDRWWEDPETICSSPEDSCLGLWANTTDYLVHSKAHPRVQCSEVSVVTSGLEVKFIPTENTWSRLNV
jgi:hypothetical protein